MRALITALPAGDLQAGGGAAAETLGGGGEAAGPPLLPGRAEQAGDGRRLPQSQEYRLRLLQLSRDGRLGPALGEEENVSSIQHTTTLAALIP